MMMMLIVWMMLMTISPGCLLWVCSQDHCERLFSGWQGGHTEQAQWPQEEVGQANVHNEPTRTVCFVLFLFFLFFLLSFFSSCFFLFLQVFFFCFSPLFACFFPILLFFPHFSWDSFVILCFSFILIFNGFHGHWFIFNFNSLAFTALLGLSTKRWYKQLYNRLCSSARLRKMVRTGVNFCSKHMRFLKKPILGWFCPLLFFTTCSFKLQG